MEIFLASLSLSLFSPPPFFRIVFSRILLLLLLLEIVMIATRALSVKFLRKNPELQFS